MSYSIMVFPRAKLTTGDKADKAKVAALHGTAGEMRTLETFREVVEAASQHSCSLNEYTNGRRHSKNFIRTNLIGLDVDDNWSRAVAVDKLRALGLKYGIYPSFNNSDNKERFRVIVETSEYITDEDTYRKTWESIHKTFNGIDASCKDIARLYFHANPNDDTEILCEEDGGTIPVVAGNSAPPISVVSPRAEGEFRRVASQLRQPALNFVAFGPVPGEPRNPQLFKALSIAKEDGYDYDFLLNEVPRWLRKDPDFMSTYGESKIQASVDQVWFGESRFPQPALFKPSAMIDPEKFVPDWLKQYGYALTNTGDLRSREGELIHPDDLFKYIYLDYDRIVTAYNSAEMQKKKEERGALVPKKDRQTLQFALSVAIERGLKEQLDDLRERLKYDGSEDYTELRKFAKALTNKEDEVVERVLAHFVWQVKRKIYGKKVTYHMMPVSTGPQGNGKSESMKRFISPIAGFIFSVSLKDSADRQRFGFGLKNNFIAFCDEMEQADRTDIDALKNTITAETMSVRRYHSQKISEVPQNCTPIGCSNKSLAQLLYDPTGMRRFYEIITDEKMKANGGWCALGEIDFLKLWKEIDEGREEPYIFGVMEQIATHQSVLRTPEPIEAFLEEVRAMPVLTETIDVSKSLFYREYKHWCVENGHVARNSIWFGRDIKKYGIVEAGSGQEKRKLYTVAATYLPNITKGLDHENTKT